MFTEVEVGLAAEILGRCRARQLTLALAESCTGGLVAGVLTAIAGASDVLERGFVTYSNRAKEELLGVPAELLARAGAVSEAVARAMAEGAIARSPADIGLAITGIAGPGGGSAEKPVGLVHLASAVRTGGGRHQVQVFSGDRHAVRLAAVRAALALLGQTIAE